MSHFKKLTEFKEQKIVIENKAEFHIDIDIFYSYVV